MPNCLSYNSSFRECVIDLCMKLYEEDPEGEPMDADKISATLEYALEHPQQLSVMMITEGADVVGYAILVPFYSNEHGGIIMHIDEMYIKQDYRSRGIATEFINNLKSCPDYVGVALEATPSNIGAMKLYETLGFESSENTHMLLLSMQESQHSHLEVFLAQRK